VASDTTWKKLLGATADDVCIIPGDESELDDLAQSSPKGTAARVIRGTRCTSKDRTFQEWAAALQFPAYFGHNWDAFVDCLHDLDWLNARRAVAIVTHADEMLPRSPKDFTMLIDILLTAQKESPLLVVLHCAPGKQGALRKRITKALAPPAR
jgi:hypothetical protein